MILRMQGFIGLDKIGQVAISKEVCLTIIILRSFQWIRFEVPPNNIMRKYNIFINVDNAFTMLT